MKQLTTLKLLGFFALSITATFPAFTMKQLAKRFNYLNPEKIIQLYKEHKTQNYEIEITGYSDGITRLQSNVYNCNKKKKLWVFPNPNNKKLMDQCRNNNWCIETKKVFLTRKDFENPDNWDS